MSAGSNSPHYPDYIVDRENEFTVSTDAYRGQKVFEDEIDRIFHCTWIFLCHESELPEAGSYKSTLLGLQPVIVTRDRAGDIHALLNVCTHRGATLCRSEKGKTRTFVCPYHGWSFDTQGKLVGVPDAERYPECFDKASRNLHKVPRVASYAGLVFGSMNPDVEPLEDFLGGARKHIDIWARRAAGSRYVMGTPHRYMFNGNWKFQSENVYDGYHPGFVHRSAFNTIKKYSGSFVNRELNNPVRQQGYTRGYEEGHGTLEAGAPLESGGVDDDVRAAYEGRLTELYGEEGAAEVLTNRQFLIFPNLTIFDFNIRVIQPIAQDRTEVYSYPVLIEDAHPQINNNRMLDAQTRIGTAGILSADDIDVFAGNQNALKGVGADTVVLSRGLGKETEEEGGGKVGVYSDETPQRAFWRKWVRLMKQAGN
ncbi:aromatic ring-hydroxylating oxygenase subunit alpha [Alkalilimnicola sp. S0819]|uniref:aromatic ring-hydroxylating oxygenase subunit alpha n=1 Tax=Alkalilimnicola sp. S0819 TaxID=2613922 RepID=UPI001261DC8B|nr:aromatic ring-hydroxylating dioxygenase subunit alpha [Alkalilimnicola sp. S0819]KAB7624084.1 Rieske 2Fe-2S domain-containing protein [Alkalilimnicola sp. S0819]MPQ16334.1 Rieske 2Fe-2S domain-containing protein [Alkalilimnicola sp. S0819]